jgi:hypothetical protein
MSILEILVFFLAVDIQRIELDYSAAECKLGCNKAERQVIPPMP